MFKASRKTILRALIVVAVLGLGAGAYHFFSGQPKPVTVASARLAPVSEIVYATGTIEPVHWAKVVPLQRKRIVDLCRCEGQQVTKGQVLGQQEDTEERAVLKELEIRHEQLRRDLDRARKDRDNDKITKAELEQKETAFKESSSRIAAQQSRLESLIFRSPMDGMVLRRDGEIGEIVGPTDVLFWVGKPSPLQIVADINEEEITKIAVGQAAFVSNEAFRKQALRASVSQITPKGDPTRKTFRVFLQLPEGTPLRIGMSVEVNIVFNEKPAAVVVPLDAVSGGTVQVVDDGQVRRVSVKTGVRGSHSVEIIGDVAAGTAVVSPFRIDLATGARVLTESTKKAEIADVSLDKKGSTTGAAADPRSQTLETSWDRAVSATLDAHILTIVDEARRQNARR